MSSVAIKLSHFSGLSHVADRTSLGLAAILRGMLIDTARLKIEVSGVHDFTDNSTGTSTGGALLAMPVPSVGVNATSAGGVQVTALNASLVKLQNAGKVITNTINEASALLGLPANVSGFGTQVTGDTIPAQDLTSTAASGTAAATLASAIASFNAVEANVAALAAGVNAVLVAVGAAPVDATMLGSQTSAYLLTAISIPATVAVAAGPGALAKADADAFLDNAADNIATLAAAWNAAMNQGSPGAGPLHVIAG